MGKNILVQRARDMALLVILVLAMALPGLSAMPVIDRDEARYAQATVQMIETGDYINIRFQDRARNKKPAGAYWAQAASVKAFSDVEKRQIWAHRIPSVLAAILAVLATYWGGARMFGRETALIGAALLATSMIFVFEAHIAKTDALLCGFSALALAALGHIRNGGGRKSALLFWLALGCGVMIKGPLLPMIIVLCFVTLALWERKISWMKPLTFWLGPLLFLAIILPWGILIWKATDGKFFTDAIGGDLGNKLKGGQETHGGWPGYYALTTWLAFWPACLFLLPGLAFAVRAGRGKHNFDAPVAKAARLLLCWSMPFFILLEIIPTKLPHYPLPIYPAWALLAGVAILTLTKVNEFPFLRRLGASFYLIISIILAAALLGAEAFYGAFPTWTFAVMGIVIVLSLFAAVKFWAGRSRPALIAALLSAILITIPTYQFTMPSLEALLLSRRVKAALVQAGVNTPIKDTQIMSLRFTEPSLVYRLGSNIMLGEPDERIENLALKDGDILILDQAREDTSIYRQRILDKLRPQNSCLVSVTIIEGTNYAKGAEVKLDLLRLEQCPRPMSPATPDEAPATTPGP